MCARGRPPGKNAHAQKCNSPTNPTPPPPSPWTRTGATDQASGRVPGGWGATAHLGPGPAGGRIARARRESPDDDPARVPARASCNAPVGLRLFGPVRLLPAAGAGVASSHRVRPRKGALHGPTCGPCLPAAEFSWAGNCPNAAIGRLSQAAPPRLDSPQLACHVPQTHTHGGLSTAQFPFTAQPLPAARLLSSAEFLSEAKFPPAAEFR